MSWLIVIGGIVACLAVIGITMFIDDEDVAERIGMPAVAVGFILIVALVIMSIRTGARAYDHNVCGSFGDETGHTVKFADFNYWTWDCLVLDPRDGTWLPRDQFRNVDS